MGPRVSPVERYICRIIMGINLMYNMSIYRGLPGVGDGADGHGPFGANGGRQGGCGGPGPSPLSRACHGDQFDVYYVNIEGFLG